MAMHRIDATFCRLRKEGRPAFIAYITAGDPDLATTGRLVQALEKSGCDLIELGVPFSDPLADGVVNQRAAQRALASGTTLAGILKCAAAVRSGVSVPLILFSYFNPLHKMGIATFAKKARAAGIDGVLILDLPPEESRETQAALRRHSLKMIYLIAPTSSEERIQEICKRADGFLYGVSRTGVTGAKKSVLGEVQNLVQRVRARTKLPVVVGFGVSTSVQVRAIGRIADGVVVGSAIVSVIEKYPANPVAPVTKFVADLALPLRNCRG